MVTNVVLRSGCDNHDVALTCFVVSCRPNASAAISTVCDVGKIANLSISQVYLDVHQKDFTDEGLEDERVSSSCADLASTNDCYTRRQLGKLR
jgi:hypothetical protein